MIVTTYLIRCDGCDGCDAYYDCDSESVGYLEKRAKAAGWIAANDRHYCPKCKLTNEVKDETNIR